MLYQIELPYSCYGVEVENEKVTDAPPLAGWMVSKSWESVQEWVKKKGGIVKVLSE